MPRYRLVIATLLLLVLTGLPAWAQDSAPTELARTKNSSQTLILRVENDKFLGGTDEEYTNGLALTWISPDLKRYADDPRLPAWLKSLAEDYPLVNEPGRVHNISLTFGHSIFTPKDVWSDDPPDDQRPYAGWLYASLGLHSKTARRLDTIETTLGVVGPSALGEQVQNNFHNAIGSPRSEGWDHQLHDEPGLMLTWERDWRFMAYDDAATGLGFDVIPHIGLTAGNVMTYANMGGEMRLGFNLPADFGTALIRPGGSLSAPVPLDDPRSDVPWWGLHLFVGADGRAVARNVFLDGNTWEKSPHVSKEPLVADLMSGICLTLGDVKLTYTQAYRTQEYEGQPGGGHVFGSLELAWSF